MNAWRWKESERGWEMNSDLKSEPRMSQLQIQIRFEHLSWGGTVLKCPKNILRPERLSFSLGLLSNRECLFNQTIRWLINCQK